MVMMLRSWQITITPELLIKGDLIRVEQPARFEMGRQVHRTQAALQLGNCRRRGGETIRCNLTFGKELAERLFLRDQLTTERLGGGAHAIKDRLHIALLCIGQNRSSPHELHTCRPALPACRWTIARALAARLCPPD